MLQVNGQSFAERAVCGQTEHTIHSQRDSIAVVTRRFRHQKGHFRVVFACRTCRTCRTVDPQADFGGAARRCRRHTPGNTKKSSDMLTETLTRKRTQNATTNAARSIQAVKTSHRRASSIAVAGQAYRRIVGAGRDQDRKPASKQKIEKRRDRKNELPVKELKSTML